MEIINFDDIRPFNDSEVPNAIKRVSENPIFAQIIKYLFPDANVRTFITNFRKIKTIDDFQSEIMYNVIHSILAKTTETYSGSGFEQLSKDKSYLFLSNHRDILLDSAILQIFLHEHGLQTSEITFGSNLMMSQFVIDIGKLNKMFKIVRGGNIRDVLENSLKVSQYMRYAITEKHQSIWIAQRNGRVKDGFDSTETAVLKMFAMSSKLGFVNNMNELNITPLVISYEYEPCDFFKTRELYISKRKLYEKSEGEDLNSIVYGIRQWKGNLFLNVCPTITEDELKKCDTFVHNEKFKCLSEIIDKKIYQNYKLWKTNYIAHDLLHHKNSYSSKYSVYEKDAFQNYMNNGLKDIEGNSKELEKIFLQIYANPVDNCHSI
ncbi:MAG: hypothetical protein FWH18_04440 [Marinilabiliaceae bacterium]|nr:hypothetical protein [Marinilabiliaceae bacterium]